MFFIDFANLSTLASKIPIMTLSSLNSSHLIIILLIPILEKGDDSNLKKNLKLSPYPKRMICRTHYHLLMAILYLAFVHLLLFWI